jgi:hypothetical protein
MARWFKEPITTGGFPTMESRPEASHGIIGFTVNPV